MTITFSNLTSMIKYINILTSHSINSLAFSFNISCNDMKKKEKRREYEYILLADTLLRTVFAGDEGHWPVRSWWRWWRACCCQCRPARCASVWGCRGSWRAQEPGSDRCSPASEVGAVPQILRGFHSVGEEGTGRGCTAGPSLLVGWWPLGYPERNTQQEASVKTAVEIKVELHCLSSASSMKDVRAPLCKPEGNWGELSCRPTKSGGNSSHITAQLGLENSLIIANEHGLCCRAWLAWRGNSQGGISIALVAKHKRKDQLIDKILIRAFDLNDRSVKVAAAPSPSSTLQLLTPTSASLYELFPLPAPAFVSVSQHHLEYTTTPSSAAFCCF